MKRILISVILSTLLILTGHKTASAQLLIEEGKINLQVTPGQSLSGTITVHNTSPEAQIVRAYWEDFTYIPPYGGKKDFLPAGSTPYTMYQWVQFSPQEFNLPSYGQQKVRYSIKVPDNIQGGHYGVLFFEKSVSKAMRSQTGLSIITRVGSLFFVEPSNRNKAGKVQNAALKDNAVSGDFLNIGNIILIPSCTYYIMDKNSLIVDRGKTQPFYLPPGKKTPFKIKISPNLRAGAYTIVLTFDLGQDDSLVKEIDFTKDDSGHFVIREERD